MQNKFKSIFSSNKFLKSCGIIAIIFSIVQVGMCIAAGNYFLAFEMAVATVTVICTIIASEKQPMAANLPVAAAMMLYLIRFSERFFTYLTYPEVSVGRLVAISILPAIMAVMMFLHLAIHIAADRSKLIRVQQVLYLVVVIYGAMARINGAVKAGNTINMISYLVSGLALVFTYLTLCSAEVKQGEEK